MKLIKFLIVCSLVTYSQTVAISPKAPKIQLKDKPPRIPSSPLIQKKTETFFGRLSDKLKHALASNSSDIFISQNGSGTGGSCASAQSASFFNTQGNWGTSTGQIGPGTNIHLCGVFTVSAGTDGYLTLKAGGTSAAPITILAEAGAILQAPWWGVHGAIYNPGFDYVIVNGQNNGIIQATENGSLLANQQSSCGSEDCSSGIWFEQANNGAVVNWQIYNLYVHVSPDTQDAAYNSSGITWNGGLGCTISGNKLKDVKWAILVEVYPGIANGNCTVAKNTITRAEHGISVFTDNTGANGSVYYIGPGNDISNFSNWDAPPDSSGNFFFHHDGVHISPNQTGASLDKVYVYGNYIHGDLGSNCNSFIYFSPGPGITLSNPYVFNNLLVNTSSADTCANGLIQDFEAQGLVAVGNTLIGPGDFNFDCGMVLLESGAKRVTVKNNIMAGFTNALCVSQGANIPTSDYNVFNALREPAFVWGTNGGDTMALWRALNGTPDIHSSYGIDPLLSSAFVPGAGGSAVGKGTSLASLSLALLLNDYNGALRPNPPDIGALNSGTAPPPPPPPSITISISPATISLNTGVSQQFITSITGTTNTAATWALSSAVGTLTPAGVYTAPATVTVQQTVTVIAKSVADSTKTASAVVTLQPSINPPPPPTQCSAIGPGGVKMTWTNASGKCP